MKRTFFLFLSAAFNRRIYFSVGCCLIFAFVTLLAGCQKSPRAAARFAEAGTNYTTAMNQLLIRASDLSIDANSEFILYQDSTANVAASQYRTLTDEDEKRLAVIRRLRAHTHLLAHYFELLFELSTSDAPQQTATAIEGTVRNLNDIGNELRGSNFLGSAAANAIGSMTALGVTAKIRREVNKELSARNETIRKELATQEELLKALSESIEQDLRIVRQIRENRLVIDPLTAEEPIAIAEREKWKANRKALITATTTVSDLSDAADAIKNLREAYESLLNGKLNIARIEDALADFEVIISTAESLKELTGGER